MFFVFFEVFVTTCSNQGPFCPIKFVRTLGVGHLSVQHFFQSAFWFTHVMVLDKEATIQNSLANGLYVQALQYLWVAFLKPSVLQEDIIAPIHFLYFVQTCT